MCRYNRAICQESRADKHLTVQVHLLKELEAMLLMVRLHRQVEAIRVNDRRT
ncbi:hypothetical protein D3C79_1102010 [compost metagenome]